jgi:hypothetical protein
MSRRLFTIDRPPRTVAFSGGGGKAILSYLPGGRETVASMLAYEFPGIDFLPKSANSSVDLILTPNSVGSISPTKARLSNRAPSMTIDDFLWMMERPDLKEKLKIVPAGTASTFYSASPRSAPAWHVAIPPRSRRESASFSTLADAAAELQKARVLKIMADHYLDKAAEIETKVIDRYHMPMSPRSVLARSSYNVPLYPPVASSPRARSPKPARVLPKASDLLSPKSPKAIAGLPSFTK